MSKEIVVILSEQDLADFLDDNITYMDAYVTQLKALLIDYYETENVSVSYSRYLLTDRISIDGEEGDDSTVAELMNRMVNDWSWLQADWSWLQALEPLE